MDRPVGFLSFVKAYQFVDEVVENLFKSDNTEDLCLSLHILVGFCGVFLIFSGLLTSVSFRVSISVVQ